MNHINLQNLRIVHTRQMQWELTHLAFKTWDMRSREIRMDLNYINLRNRNITQNRLI